MLFDHNYKHYVLPQGHQEKNEKLRQTVLREMEEETGFVDLKVIKKIQKYQYHYPTKRKIIYKSIHVYLVEILSLIKKEKKFEGHENYSNKFFDFKTAIKKARWQQDKEVIEQAYKFLKKPRSK